MRCRIRGPATYIVASCDPGRLAGRVPVRLALPDRRRCWRSGRAPGATHAGGNAGPVSTLSLRSSKWACRAVTCTRGPGKATGLPLKILWPTLPTAHPANSAKQLILAAACALTADSAHTAGSIPENRLSFSCKPGRGTHSAVGAPDGNCSHSVIVARRNITCSPGTWEGRRTHSAVNRGWR